METVFNEIKHSVKNWWTSLLLGIVYIIVALWLMFSPLSSYVALSIVFSISMLISGILEIIFSLSNRKEVPSWGWYLVGGIIDLILGIYLIAYPMVSMEVIPFIIASVFAEFLVQKAFGHFFFLPSWLVCHLSSEVNVSYA